MQGGAQVLGPAGDLAPLQQQPGPLELMAGLDAARGRVGGRRPVRAEVLGEGAAVEVDQAGVGELGLAVGESAPDRAAAGPGPGQEGLEEVHVGVGQEGVARELLEAAAAVRREPAQQGLGGGVGARLAGLVRGRQGQQDEGLVVELGMVRGRAARGGQAAVEAVGAVEAGLQGLEAPGHRLAPLPRPAQSRGLGEGPGLAGLDAGALGAQDRIAGEVQPIMPAAARAVGTKLGPQWIGVPQQPPLQRIAGGHQAGRDGQGWGVAHEAASAMAVR